MRTIEEIHREDCCGCSLCANICPKKCIIMCTDEEGFQVPSINKDVCISCGLCFKKCPALNGEMISERSPRYFASAIADENKLLQSSSGGTFIALAEYIIKQGGFVCGCVWNEDMKAEHICSNSMNDVYRMMGSKYVQSTIEKALQEIELLIRKGKIVLFTGTACQVAAVKTLLPKAENLYLVDVLCHGVPSPLFFKKYVEYLSQKHRGKVVNLYFRNKKELGWGSEHRTYYEIKKNGEVKGYRPLLPAYFCSFFYGTNLRESCYRCKYAGETRISDITIGDFWGCMSVYGRGFPNGISINSINTHKGMYLFSIINEKLNFCDEIPKEKGKASNTNFYHPTSRPTSRDNFYKDIENKHYEDYIWKIYMEKTTIKQFIVSIYGRFAPAWIKKIRNLLR